LTHPDGEAMILKLDECWHLNPKSETFRSNGLNWPTTRSLPPLSLPPLCLIIQTLWRAAVDFTNYLISIMISLVVGLVGFLGAYKLFDWLTPGVNFADQLNSDNRSVAIFLAGLFIGLGPLLGNAIK
jgi:hypothetical protein